MPRIRIKQELNVALEKRIACYTMVAAAGMAAGVAPSARAAIVYTSADEIREGQQNDRRVYATIDLNHDGVIDFDVIGSFNSEPFISHTYRTALVLGKARSGNQIAVVSTFYGVGVPEALNFGQEIGPNLPFSSARQNDFEFAQVVSIGSGPRSGIGDFYNQRNKFIALKLSVGADTYYGWARLSVQSVGNKLAFDLVDYAYQSTPNLPILAGQGIPKPDVASLLESGTESSPLGSPRSRRGPSLGALACGVDAIPLWRK